MGTWSDPLVEPLRVAVVVQGPPVVEDDFTLESVRVYRKHFPGQPVIVSTWDGTPAPVVESLRATGAEVVLSTPPADPGPLNVNFQLVSTRAGIERARQLGAKFVLKTRADQRVYAPSVAEFLVNVLKAFPVTTGYRQRARIVSCGRSSYKFGLYQISDQLLFGDAGDMELYFSAPLRPSELPPDYRDVIGPICRHKSPEAYLASRFLEAIGRPVAWTLADSWDSLAGHFCVVDPASLDLYWPKYAPHAEYATHYGGILSSQPLDFREWLALQHCRPDPAQYEATLTLPLAVPLPAPVVKGPG
ncbi:WavE lipopolysaccharide synthesis family protein [Gemmata sp.]|uniref:WavE lipopolysaccharide synthesis family protein n=1 Tax=Gemmata sp. TaxID=1914242 RepID=UPI003F72D7D0